MAYDIQGKNKETVLELRISMHCEACERTVAKTVSKIKGVEKFTTDMKNQRVTIMGDINPKKVMKKLKKKTGKRVEIVGEKHNSGKGDSPRQSSYNALFGDQCDEVFTMFSDENPNACFIM